MFHMMRRGGLYHIFQYQLLTPRIDRDRAKKGQKKLKMNDLINIPTSSTPGGALYIFHMMRRGGLYHIFQSQLLTPKIGRDRAKKGQTS